MRSRVLSLVAAAAVMAGGLPVAHAAGSSTAGIEAVRRVRVVGCGGGACWPTAFAFTPNGRKIFYVERFSGEIRVKNLATSRDRRWFRMRNVAVDGEQGMLGLALDPRWREKRFLYVFYTNRSPFENRIVRLRKRDGRMRRHRLLTMGANGNHNGGVIHFGPDGMLYAVTGDLGNPALAQRKPHPAGKVLRMTKAGGRPRSNPFPRSKAWSYGHRNSFGFAFDPQGGRLWQTENGPECDDEVNLVVRGGNYGWGGGSSCPETSTEGPSPIRPATRFNPVEAPTGAAFCAGCRLGTATNGTLLVGTWRTGRIYRFPLRDGRTALGARSILHSQDQGILAVEAAPDGRVYFSDPTGIFRLRR